MKQNKPTIITIAGPSASGKTLFAQTIHDELIEELGQDGISIIYEDAYYRDQSHLTMQEREKPIMITQMHSSTISSVNI